MNEDNPELKNKLQLNIVKADITLTSKIEMISSSWKQSGKDGRGTASSKGMDQEDN